MPLRLKRFAISIFVIGHVSAVVLTNLPDCSMRRMLGRDWVDAYLLPTGLWQAWGMFAPEPSKDTLTLEAIVRDSHGLIRQYVFPRMMDQSAWTGFMGGYRHSKFAANVGSKDGTANREFAARYVIRALKLRPEDFPIDVQLIHQVWPTKPPEAPAEDETPAPWMAVIQTYNFPNMEEAMP